MQTTIYRPEVIPSVEAYEFALSKPFVSKTHRAFLAAHACNPSSTANELAVAAGFSNWRVTNFHYGRLGRKVAELIGISPARYSKGPLWTTALAEGFVQEAIGGGSMWVWRLYPNVRAAIERLGLTHDP